MGADLHEFAICLDFARHLFLFLLFFNILTFHVEGAFSLGFVFARNKLVNGVEEETHVSSLGSHLHPSVVLYKVEGVRKRPEKLQFRETSAVITILKE